MPRDGSGVYSLPVGYLAVTGSPILASQHNPPLEDIRDAISASLPRDGAAGMTGDLKMASATKITWNSGDVTVTHSANTLAFAGASVGYTFDATLTATVGVFSGMVTILGALTGTTGAFTSVNASSAVTAATLALSGGATVGGTLGVTGNTTILGALTGTTGAFTAINATGAVTAVTAGISGNATVGGTFGVTGTSTLGGVIATAMNVSGLFVAVGSGIGFYGTTPIAKQTGVAVSAAGIHAALVALGLISA